MKASARVDDGLEVSSAEEGALLKLYYKMQHYVNYRFARYK